MDPRESHEVTHSHSQLSREMRLLHPIFHGVEVLGLVVIAIITIIASVQEIGAMITQRHVDLSDLLMLFIYLEILAMVIIYLESGRLPIRIPLYIAIVALARYLILDMKEMSEWKLLTISAAIILLAAAVLILRYGHHRYPYPNGDGSRHKRATNQSPSHQSMHSDTPST